MPTITIPATPVAEVIPATPVAEVIDAMRSMQTESDRWNLADALQRMIPTGVHGFQQILDQASAEGVAGKLRVNTLRLYRDTANRWPADRRVPNVSFSAHRESMTAGSIDAAAKVLTDLAKNLGADKVTVASVRAAINVQQGKVAAKASTAAVTHKVDVLEALSSGGSEVIAAIDAAKGLDLDKVLAGLNKIAAHVERLQAKANRKAAAVKSTPKAAASAPKTAKPSNKPQGDLRGM